MKVFGLSDIGSVRAENQDCFAIEALGSGYLAVVCDGMGGAAAGSLASDMTCSTFCSVARASLEACGAEKAAQSLSTAADAANRAVFTRSMEDPDCEGMGSTLVALYVNEEGVVLLNVGDSRGYRISAGQMHKLTHDHSYVQELLDSGKITQEQARRHPRKNVITRVIGGDIAVRSDVFESEAEEGDVFLLCSDGLTNAVSNENILNICMSGNSPEIICRALIDAALADGARDNVTAVIVIFEKGAGKNE